MHFEIFVETMPAKDQYKNYQIYYIKKLSKCQQVWRKKLKKINFKMGLDKCEQVCYNDEQLRILNRRTLESTIVFTLIYKELSPCHGTNEV